MKKTFVFSASAGTYRVVCVSYAQPVGFTQQVYLVTVEGPSPSPPGPGPGPLPPVPVDPFQAELHAAHAKDLAFDPANAEHARKLAGIFKSFPPAIDTDAVRTVGDVYDLFGTFINASTPPKSLKHVHGVIAKRLDAALPTIKSTVLTRAIKDKMKAEFAAIGLALEGLR